MSFIKSKGFIILTSIFITLGLTGTLSYLFYFRFYKSTTDAYISGNLIPLNTQVGGFVKAIYVDETQHVQAGQLLVLLDETDAQLALDKQGAHLGNEVRKIASLIAEVDEAKARVMAKKASVERARYDYVNRQAVVALGGVSQEDFEHAQTSLTFASADLLAEEFRLLGLEARLQNSTPENHPDVEIAKALYKEAFLRLHRCRTYAPYEGIITQRQVQVGNTVAPSTTLLSLVPLNQIWINANFKETQIKKIRIGQKAHIVADMWGHKTPFHGSVVGHNPGTGAVFSILPPQNATGNWIKIVQRVPIRIALDPEEIRAHPLWLGLSTRVKIHVHDTDLPLVSSVSCLNEPLETPLFDQELEGSEIAMNQIIQDNLPKP